MLENVDGTPLSAGVVFVVVSILWLRFGKRTKYSLVWSSIFIVLVLFGVVLLLKGVGII